MSKLPVVSGRKLCKVLGKIGYFTDHQTGSHVILRQEDSPYRRLTVPDHKEVAKGYLEGYFAPSWINCGRVSGIAVTSARWRGDSGEMPDGIS